MKKRIAHLLVTISFLTAGVACAQALVITTTNMVTVTVTNVVTITNFLVKAEAATNGVVQPPKNPWESSVSAGLTLTRGNSSTLLVTGGIQTHKKTSTDEIGLGADGGYGVNNSVRDVDTLHAYSQYNHLFNERVYGYFRAEALHDGVADLQYRINVGPGVGHYFLKGTNTTLAAEFGSTFVNQRLGNADDNYATLRLAERFEHKFNNYGARVWESAEILPQVNQFNNYIMNAEIGIESAISKSISLRTFVVDNFNNEPAAGRQKNDVKLVSGISYKF